MKSKKTWKISILSLGLGSIVGGTSFGIIYVLEENKKNNKIIKRIIEEKGKEKEIKIEDLISSKIIDDGILDFKFKDYIKIIKSIKNDDDLLLSALVNEKISNLIKSIDDDTYRTFLNLVLNKGLLNANYKEEKAITKILNIFLKDNKWFKFIKHAPSLINNGINKIVTKNNALLDEILPFLDKVAEKLVKKFEGEAKEQTTKRLESLKLHLYNVARKFLIDGYNDKTWGWNDEETSLDQITDDVIKIVYLVTDSSDIPKSIPILGYKIKPIIRDFIYGIIEQLFQPSSGKIKEEIDKSKESIKSLWANITQLNSDVAGLNADIIPLKFDIEDLDNKINAINNKRALTEAEYNEWNQKIEKFNSEKPYDSLMLKLGINNDDLTYIKANEGKSEFKWFKKEYNAYWVLAKSLWHNYPNQNKEYENEEDWNNAIKKSWEGGVTPLYDRYWPLPDIPESGEHDETNKLIKKAYGNDIHDSLKAKWTMIKNNEKLIDDNKNNTISQPSFKDDYHQFLKYESEGNTIKKYNENKILKQNEIKTKEDGIKTKEEVIKNKKEEIKLLIDKIKTFNNGSLYRYETINKITEEKLKANNLLKGKGLLLLSQKEIEYVLYKMKNLLLNINEYIDISSKKTLEKLEKRAKGDDPNFFTKTRVATEMIVIKAFWKEEMDKIANPIIKNTLTTNIKNDIKFVDSIKIANILYKIFDIGLKSVQANDALYLINIIKRFYKEFDNEIKLSDRDIINIYNVLKKGFNSLTKLNKKSILDKIIELINLPDEVKKIVMKFVKIDSETNIANNNE